MSVTRRRLRDEAGEVTFDFAPMVDIVLLLLIIVVLSMIVFSIAILARRLHFGCVKHSTTDFLLLNQIKLLLLRFQYLLAHFTL